MLPYAAYLRVYEPVRAFPEPERSQWERYADSADRPRRVNALDEEHGQALRRLARARPILVPAAESGDAYVRRTGGELYVSPWQTRLRSWTSIERLVETAPPGLLASGATEDALGDFERWRKRKATIRTYIRSSTWHVPISWFLPFIPEERWLVLGPQRAEGGRGQAVAAPARTMLYVTSMPYARQRVGRAVRVAHTGSARASIFGQVVVLDRWLSEFHPGSLVELDYGGLVHLIDDQTLCADESVGEVRVAVAAIERGEEELTIAMYSRLRARWCRIQARQTAN